MGQHPFDCFGCANAAVRLFCGDLLSRQLVNRRPCGKGDHFAHVRPHCRAADANPFPENKLWSYLDNAVREKVR
jgi:hypothetical protein